jgi:hypothetical protein
MTGNSSIYNEAFGEKLISFFCLVIAFFEDRAVDTVCRILGGAAIAVGIFFYVSAVTAGSLGITSIVVYGAMIIAASAFVFRTGAVKRS